MAWLLYLFNLFSNVISFFQKKKQLLSHTLIWCSCLTYILTYILTYNLTYVLTYVRTYGWNWCCFDNIFYNVFSYFKNVHHTHNDKTHQNHLNSNLSTHNYSSIINSLKLMPIHIIVEEECSLHMLDGC